MTALTAPGLPLPRPAADGEPTPIWDALIAERGPALVAAADDVVEALAPLATVPCWGLCSGQDCPLPCTSTGEPTP